MRTGSLGGRPSCSGRVRSPSAGGTRSFTVKSSKRLVGNAKKFTAQLRALVTLRAGLRLGDRELAPDRQRPAVALGDRRVGGGDHVMALAQRPQEPTRR